MINRKSLRAVFLSFLVALGLAIGVGARGLAQSAPFYWDHINVSMDVQTNGDVLVTEEQKYVFQSGANNQRYRYILLDKVNKIVDVTIQENGQALPVKTDIKNNQLWISWEHPLKAPESHTFQLRYRLIGSLQVNGGITQVYWKPIFADRAAPIQSAKVWVHLPKPLVEQVRSFQVFGTPATARQVRPGLFEFVATEPIPPQRYLEVQITVPSGILHLSSFYQQPTTQPSSSIDNTQPRSSWLYASLILSAAFSTIFHVKYGSYYKGSPIVVVVLGCSALFFGAVANQAYILSRIFINPDAFLSEFTESLPCFAFILCTTGCVASAIKNFIKYRICPQCQKALDVKSKTLIDATPWWPGTLLITRTCPDCSYKDSEEKLIPYYSSSDGGGGGGDGGGGGGDGGGGGGDGGGG